MFFIQGSWYGFLAFPREQTGPLSGALWRSKWWWKYGSLSVILGVGFVNERAGSEVGQYTPLCRICIWEQCADLFPKQETEQPCGHCSPRRVAGGFIGTLLKYSHWAAAGMVTPGAHRLEVGITEKEKYWGVKNMMFQLWRYWAVGGLQRTSAGFQASFIKRWINCICSPWNKKKGGYKRKFDEVQAILK